MNVICVAAQQPVMSNDDFSQDMKFELVMNWCVLVLHLDYTKFLD